MRPECSKTEYSKTECSKTEWQLRNSSGIVGLRCGPTLARFARGCDKEYASIAMRPTTSYQHC